MNVRLASSEVEKVMCTCVMVYVKTIPSIAAKKCGLQMLIVLIMK